MSGSASRWPPHATAGLQSHATPLAGIRPLCTREGLRRPGTSTTNQDCGTSLPPPHTTLGGGEHSGCAKFGVAPIHKSHGKPCYKIPRFKFQKFLAPNSQNAAQDQAQIVNGGSHFHWAFGWLLLIVGDFWRAWVALISWRLWGTMRMPRAPTPRQPRWDLARWIIAPNSAIPNRRDFAGS